MNPLLSAWRFLRRPSQDYSRRSKRYRASQRLTCFLPFLEVLEDRYLLSPTIALSGTGQVTEETPYSLTLGPVVDPNPLHVVNQYTVNWGDNTSSTYTDSDLAASNRTVQHVYSDPGAYQITVDLTEKSVFLDPTFGNGSGVVTQSFPDGPSYGYAIAVDPTSGKLVQAEERQSPDGLQNLDSNQLVRYNPDGTLDTTFGNGTGRVTIPASISYPQPINQPLGPGLAIDTAGRILVTGGSVNDGLLVGRMNADGSLDTSFGTNGAVADPFPDLTITTGLALDSQGHILIAKGFLDRGTDTTSIVLIRLNSDGTFDPSFGGGTGMVTTATYPYAGVVETQVAVDPTTGNILLDSLDQNGQVLKRYHSDGSQDTAFGNGTFPINILPNQLAVDSSGRILSAALTAAGNIVARSNSDGSLDQSFGNDGVQPVDFYPDGLALDAQGRIVVSGTANGLNGPSGALERYDVITPDGPYFGVGSQTVTVQDATPTAGIVYPPLPTDANNIPTAPVGIQLTFGGLFSDNPSENRGLTSSDTVSWSVTLNGQPYSLPASVATNGPTFSFTPTAVGTYAVNLTVVDPDGGMASAQQTVDITSMDTNSLQNFVNSLAPGSFYNGPEPPINVTVQADPSQIDAAINALNALVQPQVLNVFSDFAPVPVTVTLNLTSGNYSDLNFSLQPPISDPDFGSLAYVTVIVNGVNGSTTVVGNSPALTITSGNVTVNNVTFTTATDAPTILVAGGSLALRSDVVQSSTGFADAAIAVTGGTVDLGSTGNPGNNVINVNGAGQIVQNTTSTPISTAGNTFESGGVVLPGSNFTDTTVSGGMAPVIPGQAVTLTATIASDSGSGTPTGSVTFVDTTSNVTLGTAPLVAGVATLTTPLSGAVGTHLIQANYTGDNTFLPSLATTSQSLTQSIFVLNGTASAALSVSGNAGINIPGTLVVDSSSKTALTESGNAKITAAGIQVVGDVSKSGNATLSSAATTGVSVVANPLANLTGPSTSGLASYGAVSYSKGSSTLNPGIYKSISASGNASLTLNPGLYLIEGGGFTVTGSASISGTGVTIYNTSSNYPSSTGSYGGITLSGNGTFSLTAPTSGAYAGIVIFQPSANTRAISLSGNAADGLGGTIYAPSALLYVSGNASVNGALVVNELSLSGNAASTQTAAGSDADNAGSTAGQLLAGNVEVYVDNSNGDLTPDELARIQDAVNAVDTVTTPYGVTVAEVSDPTQANVTLNMGTNSAAGGYAQGTLGCYTTTGQITLIQGWNWYAGADPTLIGADQYDFQTTVTHELGHALGLGESSDPTSAMYGTLTPGTTIRMLTTADLNIPYADGSADAQRAAVPQVAPIAGVATDTSAASAPSTTVASSTSTSSSGSPLSATDQIFADFAGILSAAWNAYQTELSTVTALQQTFDTLAWQSLNALLSMESGAMGMSKNTRMGDLLFAEQSLLNGV